MPSELSFTPEYTVEFPRGHKTRDTSTDRMQKQTGESSFILLSQALRRFAKLVPAEGLALRICKKLSMLNNKRLKTKNKWLNRFTDTICTIWSIHSTILNIYSILAFTKKKIHWVKKANFKRSLNIWFHLLYIF